jgi:hypothetical protein
MGGNLEENQQPDEDGEDVPEGSMVVWHSESVPCSSRCHTYPEEALGANDWMVEEEARERFLQLWE